MSLAPSKYGGVLPPWLVALASVAIVLHLAAILVPILDTPSGPWPVPTGRSMAEPPQFARSLSSLGSSSRSTSATWTFTTLHGKYLRLTNNYHFVSNRPGDLPGVEFEVYLRDAEGNLLHKAKFPSPEANLWVRHRQQMLAGALAPLEAPQGEVLAAPGASVPTMAVWLFPDELGPETPNGPPPGGAPAPSATGPDRLGQLRLSFVPQHLVPRQRPIMRPMELSVVLARSYARYLCRQHGAARAEIVRHSREPVPPGVLFGAETPASTFESLVASFGEMSR
jgi:hypothetical protein